MRQKYASGQWGTTPVVVVQSPSLKKEFNDSLSPESKAKYIFIADLLEEYGIGGKKPYVKPLAGTKKLFEIRIIEIEISIST
jgi:hypothetical protein